MRRKRGGWCGGHPCVPSVEGVVALTIAAQLVRQRVGTFGAFIDEQGTPVDINSVINVRFAGGVMASICISSNCVAPGAFMSFILTGGRVDIDGWKGDWISVLWRGWRGDRAAVARWRRRWAISSMLCSVATKRLPVRATVSTRAS